MVKITEAMLRNRLYELRDVKGAIEKKLAPLDKRRDAILADLQPMELKLEKLDEDRAKVKEPLFEIDNEISRITRALPGDRSLPPVDAQVFQGDGGGGGVLDTKVEGVVAGGGGGGTVKE